MIIKLVLIIEVFAVLFLLWYFRPRYVKLELLATIQNDRINVNSDAKDFRSEMHWWFIDSYDDLDTKLSEAYVSPDINRLINNSENLELWGINFDELGIDFNNNNVILAFSREIKEMKFKRAETFPYQSISTIKTIMAKKVEPNTIYIYMIPKYDVSEDLRAYTETSLEK